MPISQNILSHLSPGYTILEKVVGLRPPRHYYRKPMARQIWLPDM